MTKPTRVLLRAIATAFLLATVVPFEVVFAQRSDESVAAIALHQTPASMFGVNCNRSSKGSFTSSICLSANSTNTQIIVTHFQNDATQERVFSEMRDAMRILQLKKTIKEEPFVIPGGNNMVAGKGIYNTGSGEQALWVVFYEGHKIQVRVDPPGKVKIAALEPEVVQKVFSPSKFQN